MSWSEQGSGWEVEMIEIAYVNVARYQPLRGGIFVSSTQTNKQESDNQRAKQRQRMSVHSELLYSLQKMESTRKDPANIRLTMALTMQASISQHR